MAEAGSENGSEWLKVHLDGSVRSNDVLATDTNEEDGAVLRQFGYLRSRNRFRALVAPWEAVEQTVAAAASAAAEVWASQVTARQKGVEWFRTLPARNEHAAKMDARPLCRSFGDTILWIRSHFSCGAVPFKLITSSPSSLSFVVCISKGLLIWMGTFLWLRRRR